MDTINNKILELYNSNYSVNQIYKMYKGQKFGNKQITPEYIRKYLRTQGKIINKKLYWYNKFSKEEIINHYKESKSIILTSKYFEIGKRTITKFLKEKNVTIVNYQNVTTVNENSFNKIDSEEKAYWLGFLYADGNVSKTHNGVELTLKESDLSHLEKFKEFLKTDTKIYYKAKQKAYKLSFKSPGIKKDLINLGCVPAKSLILTFPSEEQVPTKYLQHFIRGYFDGDGSLSYAKSCANTYTSISIMGTKIFLNNLIKILNISNYRIYTKGNELIGQLTLNRKEGVDFINYIYENANIYLNRKYKRYEIFKNYNFAVPCKKFKELLEGKDGETF
jgi:hypothetical protein